MAVSDWRSDERHTDSRDRHHSLSRVIVLLFVEDGQATGRSALHFIEDWFGFSPDGGDGSIEIMSILVLVWIMTLLMWRLLLVKPEKKR